jgi:hypothetical protein
MSALRVPAGVYVDGVAMGGRYVSPSVLGALVFEAEGDGAERILALIYDRYDRAQSDYERAADKFNDDPARYARKRAEAEQRAAEWGAVAGQADTFGQPEFEEPYAFEWEIGFEYDAQSSTSDVDVNIRIARIDGSQVSQSEAGRALKAFRDALGAGLVDPVPPGYKMAAINWKRPHSGTGWRPHGRSGNRRDLESFNNPMYEQHGNEGAWDINTVGTVRMGSVKL